MSDDGCYSVPDFIEGAGEASDGALITFAQPKGAEYEAWQKRFTEKFEHEPITFSPQAYDAAVALLMGIEKVGAVQDDGSLVIGKKALADAIRSLEFDGVTGKVGFTEEGNAKSGVVVYQVKDKAFVVAPGQDL